MSDVVIRVEHLSKSYQYGAISHGTLHKDLQSWWARLRGKEDPNTIVNHAHRPGQSGERFWALHNISFEVHQGEIVGIIGRNGAGKSTLLKILSEITTPTKGSVKLKGRVGSLLEVGTGFHPELTGRENVYLNGAILGMRKAEIAKKFDEIVDFSGVEEFIDTPVKRYSSGMYVRLAFAIAAHLEPEILLIDEVLAVGDIRFQRKCLGKMKSVSRTGRTVLFVSHIMPTITSLCRRTILLESGQIACMGPTSDIVMEYYTRGEAFPASCDFSKTGRYIGDEDAVLLSGAVRDCRGEITSEINIYEPFTISMCYRLLTSKSIMFIPNFHFYTGDGRCAFISATPQETTKILTPGVYVAECYVPENLLNDGAYFVGLALTSLEMGIQVHFYEQNCLSFNVRDPIEGTITRNQYSGFIPGVVRPSLEWKIHEGTI